MNIMAEAKKVNTKKVEEKKKAIKKKKSYPLLNTIIHNLQINRTLKVNGFNLNEDTGIKINNKYFPMGIYAVELKTASAVKTFMKKEAIDSMYSQFSKGTGNSFIWVLIKNKGVQKNYIFTYKKDIAKFVANRFGTEVIPSYEMLNVLYDLTLDNQHKMNPKTNEYERILDLTKDLSYKYVHEGFNRCISNAIFDNLENFDLYQGIGYANLKKQNEEVYRGKEKTIIGKRTDIDALFKLDFKGAVYTYVNFSKNAAKASINEKIKDTKFLDGETKNELDILLDAINENMVKPISMNSLLLVEKKKNLKKDEQDDVYSSIAEALGIEFQRYSDNSFTRKKIIRYTPLIFRNDLFTEVLSKDYLYDYICSVHKSYSPNPQIYGTDHHGSYTNYNLKYPTANLEGTKEHFGIFGKTGSRKTTFINAAKAQMIKFDWENYNIGDMNGYKFREFDIKKSLRPFSEFVKKHNPNDVDIMETNLNKFSYNLLNCDKDENGVLKKDDVEFCVETTSFILEAKDKKSSFGVEEKTLYEELIERVYNEKKWKYISVSTLKDYQEGLYNRLISLGYKNTTKVGEIIEDEFAHLKKPTLDAVISLLDAMFNNATIEKDETEYTTVKKLRSKLKSIAKMGSYINSDNKRVAGYYNRYEAFDINSDKRWLLFDMDSVKSTEGSFAPIMWILLNRMIKQDKADQLKLREQGLPEPKIVYFTEEAHNIFSSSMFAETDFFEKAALEWRSYNIIICMITQESHHIPIDVYSSLETKFFLFAGENQENLDNQGESKEVQVLGNDNYVGIKDLLGLTDEAVELMLSVPQGTACAVNSNGTFSIEIHTTEKMRNIFKDEYSKEENKQLVA